MAEPILTTSDLRSGYAGVQIVNGVDLSVHRGDLLAIMGPNGAGKSTFLKTLFGLTTWMGGSVHFQGQPIHGRKPGQILRAGIGFCPQGRCNFPLMTVSENLEMALFGADATRVRAGLAYAFDLFPVLGERRRERVGNLSGGEQQMLEMAMACMRRPPLLLLDEPTIGLSPIAIGNIFAEIRRLHAAGLTVVLVEQNTKKAMEIATRVVVMRTGQVAYDGPAGLSHEQLGALFMTGSLPR